VSGFVYIATRGKLYMGNVSVFQQQGKTCTLSGTLCGSDKAFTLVAVDGSTTRDTITFSTEDKVDLTGSLRCGDVRFTDLPCDVKTVHSPCKAHRWGKCVSKVPHVKVTHGGYDHGKDNHGKNYNDRDNHGRDNHGRDNHGRDNHGRDNHDKNGKDCDPRR
jgi:hypothetical protein